MANNYVKICLAGAAVALCVACGSQMAGPRNDSSAQGQQPQSTAGGTGGSTATSGTANCGSTSNGRAPVSNPNNPASNGNTVANPNAIDPNTLDASTFKYVFSAGISTKGEGVSANTWDAYIFTDDPNACSNGNLSVKAGHPYFFADFNQEHGSGGGTIYFTTLAQAGNGLCQLYTGTQRAGSMDLHAGKFTYSLQAGSQPAVGGTLGPVFGIPDNANTIQAQGCNFPTDTVGDNFFVLNPNDNFVSCQQ